MSKKNVHIPFPKPATADEWVGAVDAPQKARRQGPVKRFTRDVPVTPPTPPESQIASLEQDTKNSVARKLFGTLFLGAVAGGMIILLIALYEGLLNPSSLKSPLENLKNPHEKKSALIGGAESGAPKTEDASTATGVRDGLSLPTIAPLPALSSTNGDRSAQAFHPGDKLKIGFYERLDFDEEKWGRQRPLRPAFQQRIELSGEYTVNDDGAISLPLLGSFSVTKRGGQELEAALADAIDSLIGRKGFVTIAAVERQPIYVLGPVKNPGAYKYVPGMTVLHVIALAGGLDRATMEPWQRIEAVRETGKWNGAIERTTRLLARFAVLKSEQDGSPVKIPPQLVHLIGEKEAKQIINEQVERRRPVVWERRSRESAAKVTVENATSEVESLAARIPSINETVRLRAERANSMRDLTKSNIVASPVLIQAQGDLSDVEERRQTALTALALAKQRLAAAEQDVARQQMAAQVELEREVTTTQQDIADGERELEASQGILEVIKTGSASHAKPLSEANMAYEVVRRSSQGTTVMSAIGTTILEPGDLVRIRQRNEAELQPDETNRPIQPD
jgi:polysaccharide biosynthesis/export protein ExoF